MTLQTIAGRRAALGLLLVGAGVLYGVGLSSSGWANSYYSAAAQAGASNWHAFLFGGLDWAGGISVDKPPAALWLMGLSVRVFGLSTPALLVPQALSMVAAVALTYGIVRRQALTLATRRAVEGAMPTASCALPRSVDARAAATGLLAGAILALTPVVTLMARFNNPDAVMVLLSVAAAYALVRSVSALEGGGGWLVASGALLGLAFLAKLLQAWLILPAFVAVALMAGAGSLGRRVIRTAAAGAAMMLAAGWWVLLVELTPPDQRPWIGGTQHNSILELAFGYNGLGRITGQEAGGGGANTARAGTWLRLLGSWAPEASWLLPAAIIAVVAGWLVTRGRDRRDPLRAGLVLWGLWIFGAGAVLSSMRGISHSYYSIQLAPAIAGAVALGGVLLWQRSLQAGARRARWVLVAGVVLTAVWSSFLLLSRPGWPRAVAPIVLTAAALAAVALWLRSNRAVRRPLMGAAMLVALLAAPTAWSVATAQAIHRGSNVYSGPGTTAVSIPTDMSAGSTTGTLLPVTLVDRVRSGAYGYEWGAAVVGRRAADLQLASGVPVWALGGFSGVDPHPTLAEFQTEVAASRVHYLVLGNEGMIRGSAADQIVQWASGLAGWTHVGQWRVLDLALARGAHPPAISPLSTSWNASSTSGTMWPPAS